MALPKPTEASRRKRLAEWELWLKNFKKERQAEDKKIKYIQDAPWLLNDLYWRLAEQYLRPILNTKNEAEEEHRIHPYKIISASEITIMMAEPIEADSTEEKKRECALLAWFVSTRLLEGWNIGNAPLITVEHLNTVSGYKELIDNTNRYPESFAAEHIKWLSLLNVTVEKPLFINAQCWRMFYMTCLALAQNGQLK